MCLDWGGLICDACLLLMSATSQPWRSWGGSTSIFKPKSIRTRASTFQYILDGNCREKKEVMLRDKINSSYHEQTPEVDNSSPQCRCHSNNSGSARYGWVCPRILLFGSKPWFVVPGTDLLEKTNHHKSPLQGGANAPIPANEPTDAPTASHFHRPRPCP